VLSFAFVVLILGELSFSMSRGLGLGIDPLVIPASNSYHKFIVTVRWFCSPFGFLFSHVENVKLVVSTHLFGGSWYENSTLCYDLISLPMGSFFHIVFFKSTLLK
jgi:hypothetical protein